MGISYQRAWTLQRLRGELIVSHLRPLEFGEDPRARGRRGYALYSVRHIPWHKLSDSLGGNICTFSKGKCNKNNATRNVIQKSNVYGNRNTFKLVFLTVMHIMISVIYLIFIKTPICKCFTRIIIILGIL